MRQFASTQINPRKFDVTQINSFPASWSQYWTPRTQLTYSARSGTTLTETTSNLPAKILPAVFKGNGSAYYSHQTGYFLSSNDWVFYFNIELTNIVTTTCFWYQGSSYLRIIPGENVWAFVLTDGTNSRGFNITFATLPKVNRKYSFKIVHNRNGSTTIFESGNNVGSASGTFTNVPTGEFIFANRGGAFDKMQTTSNLIDAKIYSDLTETTLVASYIFDGGTAYDVSGNNKNLTSYSIVAANKTYSVNGSLYCFDSGWTLWQKVGSPDIRVPFGCTTSPITTGYLATKQYIRSAGINMADCLIGFNETSSADAKLEIFNRSNVTIQTAASRASAYYNATSLATKSRYHVSEVFPFEALTTLFNADYQNRVFPNISKVSIDFSISQIIVYSEKAINSGLSYLKNLNHLDNRYTVGVNNNFKFIQRAINYAYDDSIITVDEGLYLEALDLTTKRINITGLGVLGTIIHYSIEGASTVSTVNISKNATFNNVLIDKREYNAEDVKPIVNISACVVNFVNCQIGREIWVDDYNSQKPMTISNGAVVSMTGSAIKGTTGAGGLLSYDLLVTDTSQFNFQGTSFFACLRLQGTAKAIINTDVLWTNPSGPNSIGIVVENDSEAVVTINTGEKLFNTVTRSEYVAGSYGSNSFRLFNNGKLTLSGNQITGSTNIAASGVGAVVLFKNVVSTLGNFGIYITEGALNAVVTFDNCQIKQDVNNNLSYPSGPPNQGGGHIMEAYNYDGQINILNSRLEFMANSGLFHSAGNPIESCGKLVIRDSTIIDNVNENDSYGVAYPFTVIVWEKFDFENVILTNQNWDGLSNNCNLQIRKTIGKHINGRLKNVTFNNAEINAVAIYQMENTVYDALDYICESECVYNTTALRFTDYWSGGDAAFAVLKVNCPL